MNCFNNVNQMWWSLLDALLNDGQTHASRAGQTVELLGWSATLSNPLCNTVTIPERKFSPGYACAELCWYLLGTKKVYFLLPHAPSYSRFADENGEANGAYGDRWKHSRDENQLMLALKLLRDEPNTRQCVVTMWDDGDLAVAANGPHVNDTPCTCSLQFHVRNGLLHLTTHMRSNDAWLGFVYDVFCFTSIQRLFADALEIGLGSYTHMVGSMHLYENNWVAARQVLDAKTIAVPLVNRMERLDPHEAYELLAHSARKKAFYLNNLQEQCSGSASIADDAFLRSTIALDKSWFASVANGVLYGLMKARNKA
jgi:thymidylate synthase